MSPETSTLSLGIVIRPGFRGGSRPLSEDERYEDGCEEQAGDAAVFAESAWVFWRLVWLVFSCRDGLRFVTVVGLFDLGGGEVIELAVDALFVEP